MFAAFNLQQMISAFIVLFAVIDIIGSIPIIINLKEKGKEVNALKATLISFALLIVPELLYWLTAAGWIIAWEILCLTMLPALNL